MQVIRVELLWLQNFYLGLNAAISVQNIFMLLLFGDFYYKTYMKKKQTHS